MDTEPTSEQLDAELEDRFKDALLVQEDMYGRPLTIEERANLWEQIAFPELYKKDPV